MNRGLFGYPEARLGEAMIFRGEYVEGNAYRVGDVVLRDGVPFVCIRDTSGLVTGFAYNPVVGDGTTYTITGNGSWSGSDVTITTTTGQNGSALMNVAQTFAMKPLVFESYVTSASADGTAITFVDADDGSLTVNDYQFSANEGVCLKMITWTTDRYDLLTRQSHGSGAKIEKSFVSDPQGAYPIKITCTSVGEGRYDMDVYRSGIKILSEPGLWFPTNVRMNLSAWTGAAGGTQKFEDPTLSDWSAPSDWVALA